VPTLVYSKQYSERCRSPATTRPTSFLLLPNRLTALGVRFRTLAAQLDSQNRPLHLHDLAYRRRVTDL
jgi:hypothetical protein